MTEQDFLELILFGMTNDEWKKQHPDKEGDMLDHASIFEQTTMAGMKVLNQVMLQKGASAATRVFELDKYARLNIQNQLNILASKGYFPDSLKN